MSDADEALNKMPDEPAVEPDNPVPPTDGASGSNPAVPLAPGPAVPAGEALGRTGRREKAALDALRTLIRDLYTARFGARLPREKVELSIRLDVDAASNWLMSATPLLAVQLEEQLVEAGSRVGAFRDGAVYCFKCESVDCEHAVPPATSMVFKGYDPMGLAEWAEYHQLLIEQKHEGVGRLFDERSAVIAVYTPGSELRKRQLGSFGRTTCSYSILGQVAAGYFRCRMEGARTAAGEPRLALTFQAVETRTPAGEFKVRLNVLAGWAGENALADFLAADANDWIARAVQRARRDLSDIEFRARAAKSRDDRDEFGRCMGRIPAALHQLAQSLERGRRQEDRRTVHARQRREDRRPVQKAMDDLAAAKPEHMFFDEKHSTFVVCGGQGRSHVFGEAGRHVTSFVLNPGESEFRVRTRRWRPAAPAELDTLRKQVEALRQGVVTPAAAGEAKESAGDS